MQARSPLRFHVTLLGRILPLVFGVLAASPGVALDDVQLRILSGVSELRQRVEAASLLAGARRDGRTAPREVLSAALADYGRLTGTLYELGHFGPVISIRIDGVEASSIDQFSVPRDISRVVIRVDPGPAFRFGRTRVRPLPPGTDLPEGFVRNAPALSPLIAEAVQTGIDAWRGLGHAKARVARQEVVAAHSENRLDVDVALEPGPVLRFGQLNIVNQSAVRPARLRRIAGLPTGQVFSPDALTRSGERLRRTGAFSTVELTEAALPDPDGRLDVNLAVADSPPRRLGFGAELSTSDGATLSAFWLHRNLFGGAERLRLDAEVANLAFASSGIDYSAGARLDFPAGLGPDTTLFTFARVTWQDEPEYTSQRLEAGIGATRFFSEALEAELALAFEAEQARDDLGRKSTRKLSLPGTVTWDRRDDRLDPTGGTYLRADIKPFIGLEGTADGLRLKLDGRAYASLSRDDGLVAAGRVQLGFLAGPSLAQASPQDLFFSGGSGTVRGQPFQSLGVDLGGGVTVGGRSFAGFSGEIRADVTGALGVVVFADVGGVAPDAGMASPEWHAGAGIGARYDTGIGPLRLDVAFPLGDVRRRQPSLFFGIGQAF